MKKVFVGLSGGVDSAVAAALLKQQNYDVIGVYMKNWSRDIAGHKCPWEEDLASARSVAAHLQIPLVVYDFEKEYFEKVTQYMISTYKKGQTPNPDVMCNSEIKFKIFLDRCLSEGADYIATGHYAQINDYQLAKAKDQTKDQTYFLYRIDPRVANKIIFPLGNLLKTEVRSLAQKFNLPNYDRPDSQGLCFVGNIPMTDFLSEFIKPKSGPILDEHNNELGQHNGAYAFTIGQRHGLGVGGGKPYYVYNINTQKNVVYVTSNEDSVLLNKSEFVIGDCKWWQKLGNQPSALEVRVRYRSKLKKCKIAYMATDNYKVLLDKPERAIAPGQSAVFYDGKSVVGGGIIK